MGSKARTGDYAAYLRWLEDTRFSELHQVCALTLSSPWGAVQSFLHVPPTLAEVLEGQDLQTQLGGTHP